MGFDQAEWEGRTGWPDGPPGTAVNLTHLWHTIGDSTLPIDFVRGAYRMAASNALLRAAVAQAFRAGSAAEVADAIGNVTGRRPRPSSVSRLLTVTTATTRWKGAFTNLVSGRFTELLFASAFGDSLNAAGISLEEETALRNFVDFRLRVDAENFELPVNVKNAGVPFRQAVQFTGLAAGDALPLATYKVFGAARVGLPHLMYVYLVDWELIPTLRKAYWTRILSDSERHVFRVLANVRGIPRDLEDLFIRCTVDERIDAIISEVGYERSSLHSLPWRAISSARCRRIFEQDHERTPSVYVTQIRGTEPAVHISLSGETAPFAEVLGEWLATPERRAAMAAGLARVAPATTPDPPL